MGLLTNMWRANLSLKDPALKEIFGYPRTTSGATVNEHTALTISAVYSCVRVISETISSLPLVTYRRLEGGGKARAVEHPIYKILKDRPNPLMTSQEFRAVQQAFLLLWGNAFAEIETNAAGDVLNLWPWRPDRVRLQMREGELWYHHREQDGSETSLPRHRVLHLRGLSSDGILGYSIISLQRESLGLCVAAQEYRARFFKNDARPGGVLEHPGRLGNIAHDNLRNDFRSSESSERRAPMILEEGMKWHDVGIPPNDAQFIEGWQVQKEDIAGIYRVPPYKIGIMKPGTVSHSSVEQANLDFWTDCIRCWAVCWEQRINMSLFTPIEQRAMFVEYLADAILRADTLTRYQAYQLARQNGWFNANDIRELENMNPLPGEQGTTYWMPSNMMPADQPRQQLAAPAPAPRKRRKKQEVAVTNFTNGEAHEEKLDETLVSN